MTAAPAKLRDEVADVPVVGGAEDLPALVDELKVDRVVFGLTGVTDRQIVLLARHLQARGVQVDVVPRLYEALGPSATVRSPGARRVSNSAVDEETKTRRTAKVTRRARNRVIRV